MARPTLLLTVVFYVCLVVFTGYVEHGPLNPIESRTMANNTQSRSDHVFSLAEELLADIELSRLPAEATVLKATRLARFVGNKELQTWLLRERTTHHPDCPISVEFMGRTGRWTNREAREGYWVGIAGIDAMIATRQRELQQLRVPDIHFAPSSANPHEWVMGNPMERGNFLGSDPLAGVVDSLTVRCRAAAAELEQLTAVRSRVLGFIHEFAANVYYQKLFSGLAESVFERYKGQVDAVLAGACGDVLDKMPSIYDRLAEGHSEAISQALNTCRRVIDAFADAVFPPTEETRDIGGNTVQLGASNHQNRINVYIHDRTTSGSRSKRLRQTLANLYGCVSKGVHDDVTAPEAQALVLGTYTFVGEVLMLGDPHPPTDRDVNAEDHSGNVAT